MQSNKDLRQKTMFDFDPSRGTCKFQCSYCKTWQNGHELEVHDWYCMACSDNTNNPMW
ncbi:hypothetical protein M1M34_gp061 [Haloarcula tailed virus 2]|uniref:Uncharacterized protein n=1 Tax=Haloarcula tailed virus 2 TaxID=2877989 RepID=A0AAE8XZZ6_9CAUD|nr:hypothetical protein M1M34_gp061 [Haloarcula tailed virus 2]UBF23272.1 hypothetical protein HATV-2_gp121 [Haloarcula tailed virus 2]